MIIVEPDQVLCQDMVKYLSVVGFDIVAVTSASELHQELLSRHYTLAIVDIDLSGQCGSVLAEYVTKNADMRIIMLSAYSSTDDKIIAFLSESGVYMHKPVEMLELAARIITLLREVDAEPPQKESSSTLKQNGVERNVAERETSWQLNRNEWMLLHPDGKAVKLTTKEFLFLSCFLSKSYDALSYGELLKALDYQYNEYGQRALQSLVHRLRRKIEMHGHSPIKAVHGIGFCFVGELVLINQYKAHGTDQCADRGADQGTLYHI